MTRVITAFLLMVMLVQVIRPIGWPGLRRRADAWKLAVGAVAIVLMVSAVRILT